MLAGDVALQQSKPSEINIFERGGKFATKWYIKLYN